MDWWIGKAKERKEAEVLLKDSQAQFETAEAGFWALEVLWDNRVALYKILKVRETRFDLNLLDFKPALNL